jgi:mRNA interferase RelE/StbE
MPHRYTIRFRPSAERDLRGLPKDVLRRVGKKIDALSVNPRPSGVKKLANEDGIYRVRAGDYRILYQIQDDVLVVLVVQVGHRRDVYR